PAVQQHHTGTIMPSYSSVDWTEDGLGNPIKMHANKELLTDWLKDKVGFDGFLISDYAAIDQIPGDYTSDVRTSINAGLDMIMVPNDYQGFTAALTSEVNAGRVPMSRIDDAVERILTQKFLLGLFEKPYTDRANLSKFGSAEHRAVAREAAAQSQVLLKNSGNALPLSKTSKVYVAGSNADDLGNQMGGWTISWQGMSGNDSTTGGTTILNGIKQIAPQATLTYSKDASASMAGYDTGVVVVGETPYAEGQGDVGTNGHQLALTAADKAAVDKVCAAIEKCVVLVVSGRPLALNDQLSKIDALVASWLPGSEGAGVADVLFGDKPFTGRLPVSWPKTAAQQPLNVGDASYDPQFPYGWGLRTDNAKARVQAVRTQLAALAGGDRSVDSAVKNLDRALAAANWNSNGTVWDAGLVLRYLQRAGEDLQATTKDTLAQDDLLVSVARDVAQSRLVSLGGTALRVNGAALTADAEHQLLIGNPGAAVDLLEEVWSSRLK
ncbi:glycoside hydrolase family 3 C-terminal domain-containing protein, partial [Motilibacter deserti]